MMQIAREALAVFYFDFIFAFLSSWALSKVAARDTLFRHHLPFSYGMILSTGGGHEWRPRGLWKSPFIHTNWVYF